MKMVGSLVRQSLFMVILILAVSLGSAKNVVAQGIDSGMVDGAIWGFKLTPKNAQLGVQTGAYRVSNHVLYQKVTPEDKTFTRTVGKNFPNGKITAVEFKDLRVRGPAGGFHLISGKARLDMERVGEWGGRFVDTNGNHWDFHISRQQE